MEVRVADAKRTTGLRAEGSRPNRARPPTPASEEASQTPGIVIRTCPNCYEDYPDEDPDAEWRAWMRVLERDGAVHKREVRRLTKMDGTEQTFVFVKFSEPPAPRTFKPKPNPDGTWTRFEPKKTPARERPQQRETTIHDRLGPKVTARAGKTRSVCPEGLTKTQKRRWQRRHSQAKRVREEAPPAAKKPQIQMKRVWRPKAIPTAGADEQPPKELPKEILDVRADLEGTSMTVKPVLDKGKGLAASEDEPKNEPGNLDQLEGEDDSFYLDEGADADYMQEDSLYGVGDGRA